MPAETHIQGDPMSHDEILNLISERLADILEIDTQEIGEGILSPMTLKLTL